MNQELNSLVEDIWLNFEQLKKEDIAEIIEEAYQLGKENK